FNLSNNSSIDIKGKKSISICTTGHERSSFTIMLACTADGTKLPAVLKSRPAEKNTNLVIIPASCTSKLQPLNATINKSFKSMEYYNTWMSSTIHTFTPLGHIKRPSYSTVATWVRDSWNRVDVDLIKRSFKCCGILIQTDSSEDNMLFDYDSLLEQNKDMDVDKNEYSDEYSENNKYRNEWNITNESNNNNTDEETNNIENADEIDFNFD
ncbi:15580_t:CDS:2, partial [Dentiscutata erythropus]